MISVDFAKATDAPTLKEVAGLKKLLTLNLAHTQVTDAGLKELVGLPRLATLNLMRHAGNRRRAQKFVAVKIFIDLTGTRCDGCRSGGIGKSSAIAASCAVEFVRSISSSKP